MCWDRSARRIFSAIRPKSTTVTALARYIQGKRGTGLGLRGQEGASPIRERCASDECFPAAPAQIALSMRSCIVSAISTAMATTEDSGKKDLDTLFRAHYGRIARVIGRVVRDQARAEELAADVFVKWRRNGGENGDLAEGWLYRTAVRGAIDEWRRQARRERFESLFSAFRRPPPTPLETSPINCPWSRSMSPSARRRRRAAPTSWQVPLYSRCFAHLRFDARDRERSSGNVVRRPVHRDGLCFGFAAAGTKRTVRLRRTGV